MDYFIPSSADTLFLGMARVIRAEELLKVFAHKYPASELYIHIEGDEAIQENNGYYTVRDGFCFRERVPEKNITLIRWMVLPGCYWKRSILI